MNEAAANRAMAAESAPIDGRGVRDARAAGLASRAPGHWAPSLRDGLVLRPLGLKDMPVLERFSVALAPAIDARRWSPIALPLLEAGPWDAPARRDGASFGVLRDDARRGPELLAAGGYMPVESTAIATVAIAVRASQRRRGLGRALLDALVRDATRRGYVWIEARAPADGVAIRHLARTFGFRDDPAVGENGERRLWRVLCARTRPAAPVPARARSSTPAARERVPAPG